MISMVQQSFDHKTAIILTASCFNKSPVKMHINPKIMVLRKIKGIAIIHL
jgi:hypothetical protein